MTTKGYTFLGWVVWQLGKRLAKFQIAQNREKVIAAGIVGAVIAGGVVAAARSGGDD